MASQEPSKIIKYALALETGATFLMGLIPYFRPGSLLSHFGASPDADQTTLDACKVIGAFCAGTSMILGVAVADGPAAAHIRKYVYLCVGACEVIWCGFLLHMISSKSGEGDVGGFPVKALWSIFWQFMPIMMWRSYTLVMKPHWFGANTGHGKIA